MKKVAIIGAGIMGNGIAQSCAQNKELHIVVIDPFASSLELFSKKISENIDSFIATNLIVDESKSDILEEMQEARAYRK